MTQNFKKTTNTVEARKKHKRYQTLLFRSFNAELFYRFSKTSTNPSSCILHIFLRNMLLPFLDLAGAGTVSNRHSDADESFKGAIGIVDKVIVENHLAGLEENNEGGTAKLEVSELVGSLTRAWLAGDDCAADHHSADTDDHDTAMLFGIKWYDIADVFAVNVKTIYMLVWLSSIMEELTYAERMAIGFTV